MTANGISITLLYPPEHFARYQIDSVRSRLRRASSISRCWLPRLPGKVLHAPACCRRRAAWSAPGQSPQIKKSCTFGVQRRKRMRLQDCAACRASLSATASIAMVRGYINRYCSGCCNITVKPSARVVAALAKPCLRWWGGQEDFIISKVAL